MGRHTGFTLTELLVIVAIVGLLVTVSVPTFRDYYTKTRIVSVMPIMQSLSEQQRRYYALNGEFPFAEDLGFGSFEVVDNPRSFHPDASNIYIRAFNCQGEPVGGMVEVVFVAQELNAPGDFVIQYVTLDINGTIQTFCGADHFTPENEPTYLEIMELWPNNCRNFNIVTISELCP